MGSDLLDFAVPDVVDVVSGKKNFKKAAKSVGRQTYRNNLEVAGKSEAFQSKI